MEYAQTQTKISTELKLYTDVRAKADLSMLNFDLSADKELASINLGLSNFKLFQYFQMNARPVFNPPSCETEFYGNSACNSFARGFI